MEYDKSADYLLMGRENDEPTPRERMKNIIDQMLILSNQI